MRVEREETRGWEGRINITHCHTLCARHAHARHMPEERLARWTCVRSALGVCSWCATCALDLSRRTHNACPACVPRVPCVCLALVQRAQRMAGVLLACTFMRRAPHTDLCMLKNPHEHNERRRMHSVGPARSTHEQRMMTHTQRTTTHWPKLLLFPCAGRASCRRDWRLKAATGRPCVLALVDSGTVPAFKCDCLRVASVFMRRRYFDLCVPASSLRVDRKCGDCSNAPRNPQQFDLNIY